MIVSVRTGVRDCGEHDEEEVLERLRRGLDLVARQEPRATRAASRLAAGNSTQQLSLLDAEATRLAHRPRPGLPDRGGQVGSGSARVHNWFRAGGLAEPGRGSPRRRRAAGQRPAHRPGKDHEADLVVLIPESGSSCSRSRAARLARRGRWWIRGGGDARFARSTRPATQVRTARYVEQDPRWGGRGHVAWGHGVVLPHSEFGNEFSVPDCPVGAARQARDGRPAARVHDNGWALATVTARSRTTSS